ncbi:sigma-70 family RNA polymerase sigma factor [Streptomyces sp. PT12]|uniref:sigma-70 family RNA polymerase sigma factor n=1 Tax=Streptomyces sp. PT12 TaxID=1510197 RepID=UPI000DE2B6C1|nr:sigma-70 family RNA polymerase sigma factor [Streptomyces sp. PT12]RBM07377.1 RNA polymerase subunit sigma [Streptomyces sp. PT12]
MTSSLAAVSRGEQPPPDDATLTTWALAARGGDRRAEESFVRAVRGDVQRYLTRLSGDAQAAEDLAQETLLRALRSLPAFEGRSSARTWLLVIARRALIDSIRYERSRPRLAETADWMSAAESTRHGHVPGFEEWIALNELLARLPPDRALAFWRTQVLGMPYAEAAEASGCPIGTVRSRVARARQTLISLLATAESEAGGP